MGKKSNHGLNYDEGYNTFALINEIEIAEAKRIVNLYHSIYPGIRQWHEFIKRQLSTDRTLTNCFGRKIRFFDGWSDSLFKAAYSALPQSTVADTGRISCGFGPYAIDPASPRSGKWGRDCEAASSFRFVVLRCVVGGTRVAAPLHSGAGMHMRRREWGRR